jgi:hypothetical protein
MKKLALLFAVPLVLAALAVVIVPMAGATRQGGVQPSTIVFSKGTTALKTVALTNGMKVDVVWKDGKCDAGYVSPPVVTTWSGPTATGGVTDTTAPPVASPCSFIKMPDDWQCTIFLGPDKYGIECRWTYNKTATTSSTARTIPNPQGSENANLYLYGRTVLYLLVQKPGTTTWSKVAVPAGANAVHIYGAHGG